MFKFSFFDSGCRFSITFSCLSDFWFLLLIFLLLRLACWRWRLDFFTWVGEVGWLRNLRRILALWFQNFWLLNGNGNFRLFFRHDFLFLYFLSFIWFLRWDWWLFITFLANTDLRLFGWIGLGNLSGWHDLFFAHEGLVLLKLTFGHVVFFFLVFCVAFEKWGYGHLTLNWRLLFRIFTLLLWRFLHSSSRNWNLLIFNRNFSFLRLFVTLSRNFQIYLFSFQNFGIFQWIWALRTIECQITWFFML